MESPTLYIHPGDRLTLNVKNNLPTPAPADAMQMSTNASLVCGAATMDASSVNVHFHGTNLSPTCHSDEVIRTLINSGQTFTYNVAFPADEPPGLYWYHPHIHGIAEAAVQGGASGAIVVEGIENLQPAVAGLPERILLIRDQNVAGDPAPGGAVPSWDVTVNYVPIAYPALTPAIIHMQRGQREFWRVGNVSADTILDLQVLYDGTPQTLSLVSLDGVPVGSQDGTHPGGLIPITDLLLPPAGRMEFILTGPSSAVRSAQFATQAINTGPDGDHDTARTLATIVGGATGDGTGSVPGMSGPQGQPLFPDLATVPVNRQRQLYFSENADQTQFLYHRRRADSDRILTGQSAGGGDHAGIGGGLDRREPGAGRPRIPHPSASFPGSVSGQFPDQREPAGGGHSESIPGYGPDTLLGRKSGPSFPACETPHGFSRAHQRGLRLSLSYPRPRGPGHDGRHSRVAGAVVVSIKQRLFKM